MEKCCKIFSCQEKRVYWNRSWCMLSMSVSPEVRSNTRWRSSPVIDACWTPQVRYMLLEKLASTRTMLGTTAQMNKATNIFSNLAMLTPMNIFSVFSVLWCWKLGWCIIGWWCLYIELQQAIRQSKDEPCVIIINLIGLRVYWSVHRICLAEVIIFETESLLKSGFINELAPDWVVWNLARFRFLSLFFSKYFLATTSLSLIFYVAELNVILSWCHKSELKIHLEHGACWHSPTWVLDFLIVRQNI